MPWCNDHKPIIGAVRVKTDKVIQACRAHIRAKRREMTKKKLEAIRKEQERIFVRNLRSLFGKKIVPMSRGEAIARLKRRESGLLSEWAWIVNFGGGHRDAHILLKASLTSDYSAMFVNVEIWSWLQSWLPKNT